MRHWFLTIKAQIQRRTAVWGKLLVTLELLKKRFLRKHWIQLIARTIYQLGRNSAGDMAASMSYYILLSVFPLLIGAIGVLGYIFPSQMVQQELFRFFETNLPTSTALLRENITSIIELRGTLSVLGLVGLFWAGGAFFAAVGRAANRAWGISQYRPFLVRKLRDFVLSLGTGVLFFVSLGIASLDAFLPQVTLWFNFTLTAVLSRIVVFILIYAAYLLIYKYMPTTTVRWRDVWLGALLGAVMFEAVLNLFTLYLDRFANYQLVYGSIASVIAFLVWTYFSSFVLITGIQFSAELAKMKEESKLKDRFEDNRADS